MNSETNSRSSKRRDMKCCRILSGFRLKNASDGGASESKILRQMPRRLARFALQYSIELSAHQFLSELNGDAKVEVPVAFFLSLTVSICLH